MLTQISYVIFFNFKVRRHNWKLTSSFNYSFAETNAQHDKHFNIKFSICRTLIYSTLRTIHRAQLRT